MTPTRSHNPSALAAPNGFSHVVVTTGQTQVQVSGQVAYDASGNVVGVDDLTAQTRQVYTNISHALASVGATFQNVIKTTLFVKDLDPDKARLIRAARAPFLASERLPASTMVGVASLARPELLLEVEAVAIMTEAKP
ncbi:MAG: RidA family protein [Pigmentiphaga sp.]|nr:RidA family protein [Pigmentiphaga sp.]